MSKFVYTYSDPVLSCSTAEGCSLTASIHKQTASGSTPFGVYDSDHTYVTESVSICKYVAKKLGHPVMQLEFNSSSIYACLEEAVSEYSQHINNYNIKNWMWEHYGSTTKVSGSTMGSTGSIQPVNPHMGFSTHLSKQYGEAVKVGGDLTLYSGSITLTGSKQSYDLASEASYESDVNTTTDRLEIQTVFNEGPAAMTRFYDPFAGSFEQRQMLDAFGMGNVAPAVSFIMRPISHDIARAQAIETNDKIRKSAYSFELQNNKLRIFPRPKDGDAGDKVYFQYYEKSDKDDLERNWLSEKVTDPSNVPYKFITYSQINASGRNWIRKFTLAIAKELLGIIRSKYASMPLPNGEVSLDGEALKAEGREEKTQLLDELKEFLESLSLTEKARQESEQAESQQQVLNKAPLKIYIG